jgi:hypothetical protein
MGLFITVGERTHGRTGERAMTMARGAADGSGWHARIISAELSQSPDWVPSVVDPREPKLPLLKLSSRRCREAIARSFEKDASPPAAGAFSERRPFLGVEPKPAAEDCVRGTAVVATPKPATEECVRGTV